MLSNWSLHGKAGPYAENFDLIEVKPKHVRWIVIGDEQKDVIVGSYKEKEQALLSFIGRPFACIRIEFEEGEGLE